MMSGTVEDRSAGVHVIPNPRPPPQATAAELKRLLTIIRDDILPLTRAGVANGSKMFGAAILDASLSRCITANTNNENDCPLWHGEVHTIYQWSQTLPDAAARRAAAKQSVFLSTHEPCCMCVSSILWSGFTQVYYLFSYEYTKAQGIPYDIQTMHELWYVYSIFCTRSCQFPPLLSSQRLYRRYGRKGLTYSCRPLLLGTYIQRGVNTYRKHNKYLSTACIMTSIDALEEGPDKQELLALQQELITLYESVSQAQDVTSTVM